MDQLGDNVGFETETLVVMGVAGSGKSTVGQSLAEHTGAHFIDADAHHPLTNIEKMRAGIALSDDDRKPWLSTLAGLIIDPTHPRKVLACSALKDDYRSILRNGNHRVHFACLVVPQDELLRRLETRSTHFFKPELLDSQLRALEIPEGEQFDGTLAVHAIVTLLARRANWPARNTPAHVSSTLSLRAPFSPRDLAIEPKEG
jgi:gluconokinase